MVKTLAFMGLDLPKVTPADLQRFKGSAKINDPMAFAAALDAFIQEKVGAVAEGVADEASLEERLAGKARALRADVPWTPARTDIQRGRQVLLEAFDSPRNLPLPEFARLARKSRQQIYKDLAAKPPRLLALSVGPRGQKLPDWQLDPLCLRLTQKVLEAADGVDTWTLYRTLSDPLDGLRGRSPVEAVSPANLPQVVKAVLGVFGIH